MKTISQDTSILGGGNITLSGGLTSGLFHDLGVSFSLDHIILDKANNTTSDGSAVVGSGSLSLTDVTIQNSVNAGCGAVWMIGSVNIIRSIFLAIRSFLRWFWRISSQSDIDIRRETYQAEDFLLKA